MENGTIHLHSQLMCMIKFTILKSSRLLATSLLNSQVLVCWIESGFCIVFLKGNDDLGLVQTRWSFVNKDENLLTRLQNINLSFHFEVEQQVNGVFINFFGFNGTAGVWRIKALEECGGWLERTTVEDMDVAVRAHLCGWKFIYLNDVKVCIFSIVKVSTLHSLRLPCMVC